MTLLIIGLVLFLATRFPRTAPLLMRIDDWLGNGDISRSRNGGGTSKAVQASRRRSPKM